MEEPRDWEPINDLPEEVLDPLRDWCSEEVRLASVSAFENLALWLADVEAGDDSALEPGSVSIHVVGPEKPDGNCYFKYFDLELILEKFIGEELDIDRPDQERWMAHARARLEKVEAMVASIREHHSL